jgi:hypothetical protein
VIGLFIFGFLVIHSEAFADGIYEVTLETAPVTVCFELAQNFMGIYPAPNF